MKYTLLQLVQHMLSDLEGDEVNSIDDTVESSQVRSIAERVYFEVIHGQNMRHTESMFQLLPSLDVNKPTHMSLDGSVEKINWVKYRYLDDDSNVQYKTVKWMESGDFTDMVTCRTSTDSNVLDVLDPSGVTLLIYNDRVPSYYTSYDDETLIFDAYDASVESTLENTNTFCHGRVTPTWSNTDEFIPDLPENLWPRYLTEVESRCFHVLKESPNLSVDKALRRFRMKTHTDKTRTFATIPGPDYGRK